MLNVVCFTPWHRKNSQIKNPLGLNQYHFARDYNSTSICYSNVRIFVPTTKKKIQTVARFKIQWRNEMILFYSQLLFQTPKDMPNPLARIPD